MVEEGASIILHCELSKPGLPVEWRKGNELLRSGEKYQLRQRGSVTELKIVSLRYEDSDVYTCTCGNIQTSAKVTVSSKCVYSYWSIYFQIDVYSDRYLFLVC